MAKDVTLAEVIDFFDSLKQFLESTEKQDLTAIHSQLGELKYKVEKLEDDAKAMRDTPTGYAFRELCRRIGYLETSRIQTSELAEAFKKIADCAKPCTCSCTKSEQPALEWEVWCISKEEICGEFPSKSVANFHCNKLNETLFHKEYEVRHNPKRKYTNESDQLREKLSEIGEQIVDLGKTIQTL